MQNPDKKTRSESEDEILKFIRQNLYVAAVSDVLDALGYRNQAMHPRLRPLLPSLTDCGFVGRARTLRWVQTDQIQEEDPYGLEIEAVDSLSPGDVVVHSTDTSRKNAPWGELMTTVAKRNGAVGCVCDSNVRDCVKIIQMRFPVYCAGVKPVDSKGRGIVKAFDMPVRCGEVRVHPGDLVFADYDGVVVIPREVEQKVVEQSLEKVGKEDCFRKDLTEGRTLRFAYEKYGIL